MALTILDPLTGQQVTISIRPADQPPEPTALFDALCSADDGEEDDCRSSWHVQA